MSFIERTRPKNSPQKNTLEKNAPEKGVRIIFFTGGTALCALSKELCRVTHNSVHLITPFDSGGSSACLRDAFHMPAVGDMRNRLLALADTEHTSPALLRLLHSRLPAEEQETRLVSHLYALASVKHPIWGDMAPHLAEVLRTYLLFFLEKIPPNFDARKASIGNLVLAGAYLHHGRQWKPAIHMFSRLLHARGTVLPISTSNVHLGATLINGHVLIREHCIAHGIAEGQCCVHLKEHPIKQLFFVPQSHDVQGSTLSAPHINCRPQLYAEAAAHIHTAEAICYPMGSFYTSIIANLLPLGVGAAIARAQCPKIYIPNVGHDAEQARLSVADSVHIILKSLRQDAGCVPTHSLMNSVIVDPEHGHYPNGIDIESIEAQGVRVQCTPLVRDRSNLQEHDARLTLNALLLCTGVSK